jgi:O-acetyl-ADP-ribose deacetylase (regulator of RNase III)
VPQLDDVEVVRVLRVVEAHDQRARPKAVARIIFFIYHLYPRSGGLTVRRFGKSIVELMHGDITVISADAIVNAANSRLVGGGGVDGAIHRAGGPSIMAQCRRIGACPTGGAVITTAGALNAKHVIHAVAPIYSGQPRDAELLASAYSTSLRLAEAHALTSIAFPSLGTGAYGYPVEEASLIALEATASYLRPGSCIERAIFVLFSPRYLEIYEATLATLDDA